MAINFRTDAELERALNELTEREGLSRQQVIRRAVLARHAQMLHGTSAEASTRFNWMADNSESFD